jgi:mitochondrial pyruvate carrier 2
MSARLGLRFSAAMRQTFRPQQTRFTQQRFQSATTTAEAQGGGFSKFWNSEVGPKTVHFWAPIMKV